MKRIVFILIAVFMLVGCKTKEVVTTRHHFTHIADSVYIDCFDTVFIWQCGDTVRIREIIREREYKYKYIADTIHNTDTLLIKTGAAASNSTTFKGGGKFLFFLGFAFAILIIFAVRIITKTFFKR